MNSAKKKPRQNDATYCRLKGWTPGTVLTVEVEGYSIGKYFQHKYLLTAIGDESILVRQIRKDGKLWREEKWHHKLLDKPVLAAERAVS